jgi:hypothetical protein
MNETAITVQIHALQPNWIEHEKPKYRLYINDDLITERTWIWDMQTYIEEDLRVEVSPGVNHTIRLDLIKDNPMHLAQFGLQNLRINGWPKPDHGGHRSELSFILA